MLPNQDLLLLLLLLYIDPSDSAQVGLDKLLRLGCNLPGIDSTVLPFSMLDQPVNIRISLDPPGWCEVF